MSDYTDRMADYVPVNERIDAFKTAFPDGSLQSEIVELTADRVTVKAYAYRTIDDERPGIGHSSLEIPGRTPYTKGSEIENAETSAWGRAIAALGFEVKRGIASAEEARNKQSERRAGGGERPSRQAPSSPNRASAPAQPHGELRDAVAAAAVEHGISHAALSLIADAVGVPKGQRANADQLRAILACIETPAGVPSSPADTGTEEARTSVPTTSQSETLPSAAAHGAAGGDSPPSSAAPAPSIEDVLAVTGGELVPPKPGTPEYKALPAQEKASARAYWQEHPEPKRPDAEQLRAAIGGDS
jgi:hypothetical protein